MVKCKPAKLLIYFMAICLMFTTVLMVPSIVSADEEEVDDSEEYDDSEDEGDDEDSELAIVANFVASKIEKNKVTLKWDKADDIDGYEISYKKASSSKWIIKDIDSDSTLKTVISKLKIDTKYNFRIRTYIYYGEDDSEEEEEEEIDDEEYIEEEEEEEEEEFDDYVYGDYSKLTLSTLDKKGEGATSVASPSANLKSTSIKATAITKLKSSKAKSVDLKWKKSSNASGYEIYMSKKKGSGFKKIKTIKSTSTTTLTKNGLKSGTKYFFKIRAYVKSGSKTVYGKYSKVKNVKVK